MFTRITPSFAVAYWVSAHSQRFGLHTPSRSPFSRPNPSNPRASRSTAEFSSAQVNRTPWWQDTSASDSGTRATVRSRFAPIVSPSSGTAPAPWA